MGINLNVDPEILISKGMISHYYNKQESIPWDPCFLFPLLFQACQNNSDSPINPGLLENMYLYAFFSKGEMMR